MSRSSLLVAMKALATGSEVPPVNPDMLRLYNMRFCPYAQRTRLVLAHKQIPYEMVNVNLKDKPEWLFERNPYGLVPVLEWKGKVVYESAACNEYLEELFPKPCLTPTDPYTRAQHRAFMEAFGKVIGYFYRILRGSGEDKAKAFRKIQKSLIPYENFLQGQYFGGDSPGMLDFHIWPWFERMEVVRQHGADIIPESEYPRLRCWTDTMKRLPAVLESYLEPHMHEVFFTGLLAKNPDYDYGLLAHI